MTVRRGQTLSTIFNAQNLPAAEWISILDLGGKTDTLRHLQIGDRLQMRVRNGKLLALRYSVDTTHTLEVTRSGDAYQAAVETIPLQHRQIEASGAIQSSLFVDGENAGLTDAQIVQFAHIFQYDVDFTQDLQRGDHFTVIYDQAYQHGKKVGTGHILAAELVNQGHTYRAVRFVNKDGQVDYYTPKGQSLRRAFTRTALEFTRISSGFSHARVNPVLHVVRPHYGTDFAAPMGTPIHATSNGRIVFIGRDGGYGNCIKLKVGSRYETIYGHMSRFRKGLSTGSLVKQGQVIGFVGMTGIATGPHLHYEFRVDGVPKNPMTVKLPRGLPLPRSEMARFHRDASTLIARIDAVDTRQYADTGATIGTR